MLKFDLSQDALSSLSSIWSRSQHAIEVRACTDQGHDLMTQLSAANLTLKTCIVSSSIKTFEGKEVHSNLAHLHNSVDSLRQCLLMYENILKDAKNMLTSTMTSLNVSIGTSRINRSLDLVKNLNESGKLLLDLKQRYLRGTIDKRVLSKEFADVRHVGGLLDTANKVVDDVTKSLFDQLTDKLHEEEQKMSTTYSSLLRLLVDLQMYEINVDSVWQHFMFWEKPIVNVQAPKVSYLYWICSRGRLIH